MMWCRTIPYRASFRACLIAFVLTATASLGALARSGAAEDARRQATPRILKDGRIANVSVHVVSFPQGESALGSADSGQLMLLTEEVATDCFLTAQVIGHVGSAEVAGSDTLNAHRLARSRADAVQASLIAGGLPATSIASVWDWQFMVRQPRATLWVFRLTPGEDCEDAPLDGAAPALVAQAEAHQNGAANGSGPGAAVPAIRSASVAPPVAERPAEVATRPAGPSPTAAHAPIVTQALPAASPSTSAAADERPPVGVIAALPGRPAPAADPAPATTRPAAASPAAMARLEAPAGEPAARPKAAANARQQRLAIVFPTNSSYFPPGAGQQLRSLLRELPQDAAYEVVLQSSVSGSQQVVGAESAEEAMRYNKWLAERRLERVRDWLGRNAAGRALTIRPDYRADDDSRQVVVEVHPTG
jgi:outer membrane protein OmpA-like peptidoglycan-associated protein